MRRIVSAKDTVVILTETETETATATATAAFEEEQVVVVLRLLFAGRARLGVDQRLTVPGAEVRVGQLRREARGAIVLIHHRRAARALATESGIATATETVTVTVTGIAIGIETETATVTAAVAEAFVAATTVLLSDVARRIKKSNAKGKETAIFVQFCASFWQFFAGNVLSIF